jgi:hypothetical protein
VFGVRIRFPLSPAIKIISPAEAICPRPMVLIGIAEPRIVSITANAAFKSPPGDVIIRFKRSGRSSEKLASKIHSTTFLQEDNVISSIKR